jgi:hypothetical protein
MPTLVRQDGFDIRMYFDDHDPPHVHVFKAGGQAKIAIGDSTIAPSLILVQGMNSKDTKAALRVVIQHQANLLEKWEDYHG